MVRSDGLQQTLRYWLPFLALVVLGFGLTTDIMDVDATQYALMSKDLLENGNWLHFYCRGLPYLDKPPLIFWTSALSFEIFGFSNWAYKLPSLLAMLAGCYGLYRTAKIWYNNTTALYVIAVFMFSFWFIMIAQDVKTDNLLIGFSCLSLWTISEWFRKRTVKWIILAAVFQSFALLAKGPIASVSLFAGIGTHILIKNEWKRLFDWHWFLYFGIIGLLLAPMTYGLYTQYGSEGVRFYYWTQSFGRITGESSWSNELGPDFFIHTTLWAFLPWTPLALMGGIMAIKKLFNSQSRIACPEWFSLGGLILPFIALSTSKFKLPHYIFITYPYLALLTAVYISKLTLKKTKWNIIFKSWSLLLLFIVFGISMLILISVFPTKNYLMNSLVSGLFFVGLISLFHPMSNMEIKLIGVPSLAILSLGLTLNTFFYPNLFAYQKGSTAGRWINQHCSPDESVYGYKLFGYSIDLYANRRVDQIENVLPIQEDISHGKRVILLLNPDKIESVEKQGIKLTQITAFPSFHISLLTPEFLNPKKRNEVIEMIYIAEATMK